MGKVSTIGVSLLTIGATLLAFAGPVDASHAPTANVDRSTIYEAGTLRQFVRANFSGAYTPDSGETIVSTTWVWGDGTSSSGFTPPAKNFTNGGTYAPRLEVLVHTGGSNYATRTKTVQVTVINPAPTSTHTVPTIAANQALPINFDIADNQGIASATLFYRHEGTTTFSSQAMTREGTRNPTTQVEKWTYSIPSSFLTAPVEYYVRATDVSTNEAKTVDFRPTPTTYYKASGGAGDTQGPTVTLDLAGTKVVQYESGYPIVMGLSDLSGVASANFFYKKASDPASAYGTGLSVNVTTKAVVIPWSTTVGGVYNWYVSATDTKGNAGSLNSQGSPGTFTLSVGPKITPTLPTGTTKVSAGGQLPVTGSVRDDKVGVTAKLAYNTGSGWQTAVDLTMGADTTGTGVTRTISGSIPMPAGEFGPRDILLYINATDTPEGNVVSSGLLKVRVSTDATKPAITGETPAGPIKAAAAIRGSWSDAGGIDASTAVVKIDGTTVPAANVTANATGFLIPVTAPAVAGLTEASHTVNVTVSDTSGNVATKQWTFVIDKTAPVFSHESPTGFVKTASIHVDVGDTGSGIDPAGVSATVDGVAATAEFHAGEGEVHVEVANLAEGARAIVVKAKDKAGNEAMKSWTFTIDKTAPTITGGGFDGSLGLRPTLTVTFADSGSGVKTSTAKMKIDGVEQTITATATGFSFTPTADLGSGKRTVVVTVEDNVGNLATFTKDIEVKAPAAPPKGGFFGLPGFEVLLAFAALGVAVIVLRRRF